jgi:hypothetical protein
VSIILVALGSLISLPKKGEKKEKRAKTKKGTAPAPCKS